MYVVFVDMVVAEGMYCLFPPFHTFLMRNLDPSINWKLTYFFDLVFVSTSK